MLPILTFGALLLAVTALTEAGSGRIGVPQSIMLVLTGAALSLTPGLRPVTIAPDFVLLLLLPPLLYSAGVGMSWRGFRHNLRPILLLAIGCVLFTPPPSLRRVTTCSAWTGRSASSLEPSSLRRMQSRRWRSPDDCICRKGC